MSLFEPQKYPLLIPIQENYWNKNVFSVHFQPFAVKVGITRNRGACSKIFIILTNHIWKVFTLSHKTASHLGVEFSTP